MTRTSPIAPLHARAEAALAPYGPASSPIDVVLSYGDLPSEYASLRKSCVLMDLPQRGSLWIAGPDAAAFLQRMVTQDLKGMPAHSARRSFWLSRKGRIDADLRIVNLGDGFLVDLDAHAVERTSGGLASYIIADDVSIDDRTESWHRLALHGPGAAAVLARLSAPVAGNPVASLDPGQASVIRIADRQVVVDRCDTTGEIGLELWMPATDVPAVFEALLAASHEHGDDPSRPNPRPPLRPAGWLAYNIARIEAGTPIYNLDFGADSLPAETGVIAERVSFTKGCYLGQEIVARMHALGHPKQVLVALRMADPPAPDSPPPQPDTGAAVFAPANPTEPVGAITSCTVSPMLSQAVIAFAMVKWANAKAAAPVLVDVGGGATVPASIAPQLRCLPAR